MNDSERLLEDNKVISSGLEMVPLSIAKQALEIRDAELRLDELEEKLKVQQDRINDAMIGVHSMLTKDLDKDE